MNKTLGKGLRLHILKLQAAFLLILALLLAACGDATSVAPVATTASAGRTAGNSTPPQGWQELVSTDEKFSILMPGSPQKQAQMVNTEDGDVAEYYYQVNLPQQDMQIIYNITITEYPTKTTQKYTPNFILQEVMTEQAKGFNGVAKEEKIITLGSVPGRQSTFKFTTTNNVAANAMTRAYMAGTRVYQLILGYPEDKKPADSDINTFFDSFKITS